MPLLIRRLFFIPSILVEQVSNLTVILSHLFSLSPISDWLSSLADFYFIYIYIIFFLQLPLCSHSYSHHPVPHLSSSEFNSVASSWILLASVYYWHTISRAISIMHCDLYNIQIQECPFPLFQGLPSLLWHVIWTLSAFRSLPLNVFPVQATYLNSTLKKCLYTLGYFFLDYVTLCLFSKRLFIFQDSSQRHFI